MNTSNLTPRCGRRTFVLVLILLAVFKVWLDSALRINAQPAQDFDDALYVRLAHSIANGEWLGDYNLCTLSKMPFYPVFLAVNHWMGLPLLVTQSLLYALAAIFLVCQLGWRGVGQPFLLGLYGLILFNPYVETRVMREGIYSTLVLCVFASCVGMSRHLWSHIWRLAGYSILLALFLSMFWLTREESIWLVPALAILSGFFAATILTNPGQGKSARLALVALPFAVLFLAIHALCAVNHHYYGNYTVCDQASKPFTSAVGALFRVEHSRRTQHLLVPREVRERIYLVSPAFRELKPYLDGDLGSVTLRNIWKDSTCRLYPETCSDYGGAWFIWVFRLAVADAGYYRSADSVNAFYARLAREINDACDRGELKSLARRESLIPPYRSEYTPLLFRIYFKAIRYILRVPVRDYTYDFHVLPGGNEAGFEAFRTVTGNQILPRSEGGPDRFTTMEIFKRSVLSRILVTYRLLFPVAVGAGLLAYGASAGIFLWRRRVSFLFVLNSAILAATAFRLLILSYVDITLFPAFTMWPAYINPFYPLGLLFSGLALTDLQQALGALRQKRPSGEN